MSEELNIQPVPLAQIKKVISAVEAHYKDEPQRIDDITLSFEFIMGSFFPKVYDNIQEALRLEHTRGYIEGLEESKNHGN